MWVLKLLLYTNTQMHFTGIPMSFTRLAIGLYKRSPLYPAWGRRLGNALLSARKFAGVRPIHTRHVPCGITLNLDREQHIDAKALAGCFEPQTIALIERVVETGWICCDVGANIGIITLLMAKRVGPTGNVFALEPSDWTFKRLRANIEINPYNWIDARRVAVGAKSKPTFELRVPCGYRLDGNDTSTVQQMPMVTLDDIFATETRLEFLKIDTDGYESEVLSGSRKTIKRLRPIILFELCPDHLKRAGSDAADVTSFLVQMGYQFENEDGHTIHPPVEALKLYRNGSMNVLARPI